MKKHLLYILSFFIVLSTSVLSAVAQEDSVSVEQEKYVLHYYAGDNQKQVVENELFKPLMVKVTNQEGIALPGIAVTFLVNTADNEIAGLRIKEETKFTDDEGLASGMAIMGTSPGNYEVISQLRDGQAKPFVFNLEVKTKRWYLGLIIGLLGGLSFFLYGMFLMSEGMKKSAGDKLRTILQTLTHNRFFSFLTGVGTTTLVQSSSAISVLTVSLVHARLMTFSQSIGILLGAGIGTTITAQLVAFKVTDYALVFVAFGFFFTLLANKQVHKDIGDTILGFGILFFGLYVMSEAMHPLRSYPPFIDILLKLENPIAGIIIGLIFTGIIQSSSAFIGIIIILASQGLLTLEAGIPLLLGSNIGTTVTAIIASANSSRDAKRVSAAFIAIKIIGVLIIIPWIPGYTEVVKWISPVADSATEGIEYMAQVVPRQIANAHTIFNVIVTLILLPFTNTIAKLIIRLLPDKEEKETDQFETKFLDANLISTPAIAVSLAKAEALRMGGIVKDMTEKIILPFCKKDRSSIESLLQQEEEVDFLRYKITGYLTKISQRNITEDVSDELFQIMYSITELEEIGDVISNTLYPRAVKWLDSDMEFSDEGKKELSDYHLHSIKQFSRAIEVFGEANDEKAEKLRLKHKKYLKMVIDLKRNHFERLSSNVPASIDSSKVHMELMSAFRIINTHTTNFGRIALDSM